MPCHCRRDDAVQSPRGRVLIVDDDRSIVTVLASLLRQRGFAVDAACCAAKAKERVAAVRYDVALVDVGLGDGCGVELAAQLESAELNGRVVMMTGGHAPAHERVVLKPFDYPHLLRTIEELAA